jgi:hypothetical protein
MALWNWAGALQDHAERRKEEEADSIYEQAVKKYDEYLRTYTFFFPPLPSSAILRNI